jgi:hypothetical protein
MGKVREGLILFIMRGEDEIDEWRGNGLRGGMIGGVWIVGVGGGKGGG